jgi:hypothetical protein
VLLEGCEAQVDSRMAVAAVVALMRAGNAAAEMQKSSISASA